MSQYEYYIFLNSGMLYKVEPLKETWEVIASVKKKSFPRYRGKAQHQYWTERAEQGRCVHLTEEELVNEYFEHLL
jgi:hypothetical protein